MHVYFTNKKTQASIMRLEKTKKNISSGSGWTKKCHVLNIYHIVKLKANQKFNFRRTHA